MNYLNNNSISVVKRKYKPLPIPNSCIENNFKPNLTDKDLNFEQIIFKWAFIAMSVVVVGYLVYRIIKVLFMGG